jgi:hypothetical protein
MNIFQFIDFIAYFKDESGPWLTFFSLTSSGVYIGRIKLSIDIKRRFRGQFLLIAEKAVATN